MRTVTDPMLSAPQSTSCTVASPHLRPQCWSLTVPSPSAHWTTFTVVILPQSRPLKHPPPPAVLHGEIMKLLAENHASSCYRNGSFHWPSCVSIYQAIYRLLSHSWSIRRLWGTKWLTESTLLLSLHYTIFTPISGLILWLTDSLLFRTQKLNTSMNPTPRGRSNRPSAADW